MFQRYIAVGGLVRSPLPRGAVSAALLAVLPLSPHDATEPLDELAELALTAVDHSADIVSDDDLQLSLFCLNALHYSGIDGASDSWEWNGPLCQVRATIESAFESALRDRVEPPQRPPVVTRDAVAATLFALAAADEAPSLSRYIASKASEVQLVEFLISRSIYQLREADPHSWAIPRLTGAPKAALVEIQTDEYGGGRPERMHSELFAATMRGMGLDDSYGHYVDQVPAIILASVNMMSLFGLHRRLRGAIVGHLAAFEITSSIPNRFYGNGFRRLGFSQLTDYFDEHVEADAVHEQIAARDLAGGLVESEPELLDDVLFGAAACLAVDGWVAEHILGAWEAGEASLDHAALAAV